MTDPDEPAPLAAPNPWGAPPPAGRPSIEDSAPSTAGPTPKAPTVAVGGDSATTPSLPRVGDREPQTADPSVEPAWSGVLRSGAMPTEETVHPGTPEGMGPLRPRRRRAVTLVASGLALALVVGGAAVAGAFVWYGWGATLPESVLPASTSAVLRLDLDPGLGQKLALQRLLAKVPTAPAATADKDAVGRLEQGFSRLLNLSPLDFDTDVRPWLGHRLAIATWSPGKDACGLSVIASTDDTMARRALAKLTSPGFAFSQGYVVVAHCADASGNQRVAEAAVAAAAHESLAHNAAYVGQLDTLPSGQDVVFWADGSRSPLSRGLAGGVSGPAELGGADLLETLLALTVLTGDGSPLALAGLFGGSDPLGSRPPGGPSDFPTDLPSDLPTDLPSNLPTNVASDFPTDLPSGAPTDLPRSFPTDYATDFPGDGPSDPPPGYPTAFPTELPSGAANGPGLPFGLATIGPGLGSLAGPSGSLIVGVRATSTGVEIRIRTQGGAGPRSTSRGSVLTRLGTLPDNSQVGLAADLSGLRPTTTPADTAREAGWPTQLAALSGGSVTVAVSRLTGGAVYSASVTTTDEAAARTLSAAVPTGRPATTVSVSGRTVAVIANGYRASGGHLADTGLYQQAMVDAPDDSTVVGFADLNQLVPPTDRPAFLRPIAALGFSTGDAGGDGVALIRLVVP